VTLEENKRLKSLVNVITKTWLSISNVVIPAFTKAKVCSSLLINEVQRLSTALPLKLSCKLMHISTSTYHYRIAKLLYNCSFSEMELCVKKHPAQLTLPEVKTIKAMCLDPRFVCWPLISIYYFGLRENLFAFSKSTFYKYTQLLGLKRTFAKPPSKTIGLRAKTPNAYLHIDTTFVVLSSNEKAALVFVSDNFSRALLGFSCSLAHGAQNVKSALEKTMETIRLYHPQLTCANLVADGGAENNNTTIDAYLENNYPPQLTKIIAQKDISFSNSPIEAINKIMKRYIRHFQPQNFNELNLLLPKIIDDYQNYRPHGSLKGLTPMEAYTQPTLTSPLWGGKEGFRPQILIGKKARVLYNQQNTCGTCSK